MLAIVLVLAAGLSRTAAADSSDVASEPVFTGLTVDGRTVSGRIAALSADRITLAVPRRRSGGAALPLAGEAEPPLRATAPETAEGSHLLFPDGDRLRRVIVGATTETTLDVQSHSALGKLTVPLDSVLGLVLTAPSESEAFDQLWDRVRSEPRSTEVVWLANGDRMTGAFSAWTIAPSSCRWMGRPSRSIAREWSRLGFDPAVVSYPRPPSDFLELTLSDGSRLGVTGAKLEKGQIVATTRFGQSIRFPIGDLVRLDPRTDAVAYLSEQESRMRENYVAFLGPTRPFRVDRTVDGHRFQLGGQVYERGLGTQSRTLAGLQAEARRPPLPGAGRGRRSGGTARQRRLPGAHRWSAAGRHAAHDLSRHSAADRYRRLEGKAPDPHHRIRRPGRRSRSGRLGRGSDHPLTEDR